MLNLQSSVQLICFLPSSMVIAPARNISMVQLCLKGAQVCIYCVLVCLFYIFLQDVASCLAHASSQSAHWVINLSLGATGTSSQFSMWQDAFKQHVCDKDGIIGE